MSSTAAASHSTHVAHFSGSAAKSPFINVDLVERVLEPVVERFWLEGNCKRWVWSGGCKRQRISKLCPQPFHSTDRDISLNGSLLKNLSRCDSKLESRARERRSRAPLWGDSHRCKSADWLPIDDQAIDPKGSVHNAFRASRRTPSSVMP